MFPIDRLLCIPASSHPLKDYCPSNPNNSTPLRGCMTNSADINPHIARRVVVLSDAISPNAVLRRIVRRRVYALKAMVRRGPFTNRQKKSWERVNPLGGHPYAFCPVQVEAIASWVVAPILGAEPCFVFWSRGAASSASVLGSVFCAKFSRETTTRCCSPFSKSLPTANNIAAALACATPFRIGCKRWDATKDRQKAERLTSKVVEFPHGVYSTLTTIRFQHA